MGAIQITSNVKNQQNQPKTIRYTQSICPNCNMILDAEVFERDGKVFMTKTCPTHGECEEHYVDSYARCGTLIIYRGGNPDVE